MRLHILADLHVEFAPANLPSTDAEAIILAGDIHVGREGLAWIAENFPGKPVVYVLGNHEFYGQSAPELGEVLKSEAEGSEVRLLENSRAEINGYTFLGCTLWSDFQLAGKLRSCMEEAEDSMTDYSRIRFRKEDRRLRASDTLRMHQESLAWLKRELASCNRARTIIVTHHAPSSRSIAPWHARSSLSAAFASHLDAFAKESGVPLWVHGHTHYNADYNIGATRVVSNQRGYPDEPCAGFNPSLVIDV